jgi:HlyD family secretion protein
MYGKSDDPAMQDDIEAVLGTDGNSGILRRGKWPILLVLAIAAGAAAYYLLGSGASNGNVQYRTDAASLGDITVIVTATGTVEPTNQVEISSELSGIIRSVSVDYNSTVKVGQVLAELDTDKLKATVDSSRARVDAARARLLEAEATVVEKEHELTRKQALADRQIGSLQDLDIAKAAYDRAMASRASAKADIKSAEADLKLSETNLEKTCICSPINGVVLSRNVDPGQVVASSLQAPVLFAIAEDLSKMDIQVDVDEADVGKVREGQAATFTVDAYPDRKFQAAISQLRFGSEIVQGVVTYKAVLTADNSELLLRPGMTATAEIVVHEEKQVLTVSNETLRFSPPTTEKKSGNQSFLKQLIPGMPQFRPASRPEITGTARDVWVLGDDGALTPARVTIGATDGRRTQIVEGPVEAGQQIAVDVMTSAK